MLRVLLCATARLAKAKRDALRHAHLAPDYVPLGGANKLLSGAGAGSLKSSYKAASEDGGDSGSDVELEEQARMTFVGTNKDTSTSRLDKGGWRGVIVLWGVPRCCGCGLTAWC